MLQAEREPKARYNYFRQVSTKNADANITWHYANSLQRLGEVKLLERRLSRALRAFQDSLASSSSWPDRALKRKRIYLSLYKRYFGRARHLPGRICESRSSISTVGIAEGRPFV